MKKIGFWVITLLVMLFSGSVFAFDKLASGPIPVAASFDKKANQVVIKFRCCRGLKASNGEQLKGFSIINAEGKSLSVASTKVENDVVIIPLANGAERPIKIKYAQRDDSECKLVNGVGLTCKPFELEVFELMTLEDENISIVFDPTSARIVSFNTIGGENLLWIDKTILSRLNHPKEWANYGGEKTWIWPMSSWRKVLGRIWPPNAEMESIELAGMLREEDGSGGASIFSVTKRVSGYNVQIMKDISLGKDENGSYVLVSTSFEPASEIAVPWSVIQAPAKDGVFYVRQSSSECVRLDEGDNLFNPGTRIGETSIYRFEKTGNGKSNKAGFNSPLIAVRRGNELFVVIDRSGYPVDKYKPGERTQVYIDQVLENKSPSDPEQYMELEFTAPYSKDIGKNPVLKVEWRIFKLKEGAGEAEIAAILEKI